MKVVLYSRVFQPQVGGVETIVRALADGLARKSDVQVTVITAAKGETSQDEGLPYRVVRRPRLRELTAMMRQADVVHLAGPTLVPLLIGLLLAKRVVVEHHGFQAACPNGLLFFEPEQAPCPGHFMAGRHLECWRCNAAAGRVGSVRMWLLTFFRRWLCQRADANIVPTHSLGTSLALARSAVVFHGLPLPPEKRPAAPVAAVPTFVFLGRLVSTKGVAVLLQAAKQLPQSKVEFQIKIIGDGPERHRLEEMTRSLGVEDHVRFLGHLNDDEVEAALHDVAAVIMPSLGGEVFGLVAAECMARGVPMVVSGLGPLTEVVGEAGLVFPPGDSAALADCLRRLIEEPGLAATLAARGRARATREFALEVMIDKHLAVYRH